MQTYRQKRHTYIVMHSVNTPTHVHSLITAMTITAYVQGDLKRLLTIIS